MLIHKLLPLFALGLNLLLMGTALAPDRRSARNVRFAYLAAALAVWNAGVLGLRWTTSPEIALTWECVLHLGVVVIPALFYHYVLAFLDLPVHRFSLLTAYVLAGGFLIATLTPGALITGVVDTTWGFAPAPGALYGPFVLYFHAYLVAGLNLLVRGYRQASSSIKRNRTLLVICGVLVSLAGGLVDFARFVLSWDALYPAGIPANSIFALALGVAIVRYRLMNVGVFAKRLLLYFLVSATLAPLLFVGLWALDQVLVVRGEPAGVDGFTTLARDALILMAVFGIALPLLRRIEHALERLMFQRRHGVRDALIALSRELTSLLDVDGIGNTLARGLVTRIPVTHASLRVLDPTTGRFVLLAQAVSETNERASADVPIDEMLVWWLRMSRRSLVVDETAFHASVRAGMRQAVAAMEREGVALLVPVFLEEALSAVLVIGERISGEVFDADEIELLETLASETTIAVRNARHHGDLRAQVEELHRTQDQLTQAAKLAAIGELAAGVAHEINNPLSVILGMSGLLVRDAAPSSVAKRRLETIVAEANRAGKIARDLLDFARRRAPERRPLAARDVLDRAFTLVESRLGRGRIEVRKLYDPDLPVVVADRDQLTQVFVNLVGNAIDALDATQTGGTVVAETSVRTTDGSCAIVVTVGDTGAGIPPEVMPRVFEPFYTTKPEGKGTGLGLSVSLGIIHAHGGTMEVESELGKGTRVSVLLPVG
ncbi:MAG: GAF domain-containing protein [Candidatus Rokubacteria bacterium]|nr:GAF domain-containing protein [Candidatus Rokubacteria bacterium]